MTLKIGVLGGMGPYAALDFMRVLLERSPAKKESEHFHVILDNNPQMPSRTRAFLFREKSPSAEMEKGLIRLMSAGVDFVVSPCNSAHHFLPEIIARLNIPFLDMIEATARKVKLSGCQTVGVIAGEVTVGAKLYENQLLGTGINIIHLSEDEQPLVRQIIEDVKLDNINSNTVCLFEQVLKSLEQQKCESIILGCTELRSVSLLSENCEITCIDSITALADACINRATLPEETSPS